MYEYAARLTKLVDADTLDLSIDVGFGIRVQQRARLLGLNAPEKNTPAGKRAIAYATAWLDEHGPDLIVRTVLDRREKYGRLLATVTAGGRSLNDDLITAGHAVAYDGGQREAAHPTVPQQPATA